MLSKGGAQGDRVAILMSHDAPQIAALLAILKAGRIAVTLNPSDPAGRLSRVVDNAQARLILTDEIYRPLAAEVAGRDADVLGFHEGANGQAANPGVSVSPDDVAALTYTSGSTGVPKAVMQTHRQIFSAAFWQSHIMELVPETRSRSSLQSVEARG